MIQLTNDQQASVLVFMPMVDILNIPCDCQFVFFLYFMNFTFHSTLDAVRNILRLHYRSMKCAASFSQGCIGKVNMFFMYV